MQCKSCHRFCRLGQPDDQTNWRQNSARPDSNYLLIVVVVVVAAASTAAIVGSVAGVAFGCHKLRCGCFRLPAIASYQLKLALLLLLVLWVLF